MYLLGISVLYLLRVSHYHGCLTLHWVYALLLEWMKSSFVFFRSGFDEERPEVPMLFRDVPSLLIIFVLTMPQPLRKGEVTLPAPHNCGSTDLLRAATQGHPPPLSSEAECFTSLICTHVVAIFLATRFMKNWPWWREVDTSAVRPSSRTCSFLNSFSVKMRWIVERSYWRIIGRPPCFVVNTSLDYLCVKLLNKDKAVLPLYFTSWLMDTSLSIMHIDAWMNCELKWKLANLINRTSNFVEWHVALWKEQKRVNLLLKCNRKHPLF